MNAPYQPAPPASSFSPARELPVNLDAEMVLLGDLLANNAGFDQIEGLIEPEHFADPAHQEIFAIARRVVREGGVADANTLQHRLKDSQALTDLGGLRYLGELVTNALTIIAPRSYARTIADLHRRRALIALLEAAAADAYRGDNETDAGGQIEALEQQLFTLGTMTRPGGGLVTFGETAKAALEDISRAIERGGKVTGTPTGLTSLDDHLGGLQRGDLIVLAARPSMGKSALAIGAGLHAAQAGRRVAIFSLEMSGTQLAIRIMAAETGIAASRIGRGDISPDAFGGVVQVSDRLAGLPLSIDDSAAVSVAHVKAQARQFARRMGGLDLIIVDHIGLMTPPKALVRENRTAQVSAITAGLKEVAKDLQVPVLALSQLSRNVETREDKRPMLADLRDSGSIEQDADVVMFLYREAYYLARQQPDIASASFDAWEHRMEAARGRAELNIAKFRNGGLARIPLLFDEQTTRFSEGLHETHGGQG